MFKSKIASKNPQKTQLMNQPKSKILLSALLIMAACQLRAQVIWSNTFGSYNLGDLDANEGGGPNQAPNGGPGNPWWGPNPGNLSVATSFNGITPYNGAAHLVDGQAPSFFAEELNNIGYRLNGGNNFLGGVTLSWAFYDTAGAGANASGYNDIAYLNGYQSANGYTSTADYTGSGPDLQSTFTSGNEILGLGANNATGANAGFYQARVLGASTADDGASVANAQGWFNLSVARTVGWHTASIVLGAPNGANTTVTMYIDGHDVLDETTGATVGVNTIAVDSGWGSQVGAFDNFAVTVPEPGTVTLLVCGGLAFFALRHRAIK
jgi:hypothetical protein